MKSQPSHKDEFHSPDDIWGSSNIRITIWSIIFKLEGQILIVLTNRRIGKLGVEEEEGKVFICKIGPTFPDQFQLYGLQ